LNTISQALRALVTRDDKLAAVDRFIGSSEAPTVAAFGAHLRCDEADARRIVRTLENGGLATINRVGEISITPAGKKSAARVNSVPPVSA
jgi:Mn-dependent DtxR family transcriptional regulator